MGVIVTGENSPYNVGAGQSDTYDVVSSAGFEIVDNGGIATGTVVSADGELYVYPGGIATDTVVASGGYEDVNSGGVVTGVVNSGGFIELPLANAYVSTFLRAAAPSTIPSSSARKRS